MKDVVLYVDDEFLNLELFELNFSEKFKVLLAEDGAKGLEILQNNSSVKVVIADYKMPGMNGMEFIHIAKHLYPDTKFSILTGYDIFEEIQCAIENGTVEYYFSKPFNYEKIETAICKMYND
jgi:two-component system, response regulator, stage 0 sporulation protein F